MDKTVLNQDQDSKNKKKKQKYANQESSIDGKRSKPHKTRNYKKKILKFCYKQKFPSYEKTLIEECIQINIPKVLTQIILVTYLIHPEVSLLENFVFLVFKNVLLLI